ncbi:MAG: hypothetical protein IT563_01225, partial [Alphaproteobacteria bacterium]|nr:hypothetical protein [Alphaproteobacteria bacterium]
MIQKFSKRTLRTLVVTNVLALLLSGPMAAIGPAMAQQSPYPPPPAPYPQAQPGYVPAPVPGAAPGAPGQPGQAAPSAAMPSDMAGFEQPWPRAVNAGGLNMMIYQPQVEAWNGNV